MTRKATQRSSLFRKCGKLLALAGLSMVLFGGYAANASVIDEQKCSNPHEIDNGVRRQVLSHGQMAKCIQPVLSEVCAHSNILQSCSKNQNFIERMYYSIFYVQSKYKFSFGDLNESDLRCAVTTLSERYLLTYQPILFGIIQYNRQLQNESRSKNGLPPLEPQVCNMQRLWPDHVEHENQILKDIEEIEIYLRGLGLGRQ